MNNYMCMDKIATRLHDAYHHRCMMHITIGQCYGCMEYSDLHTPPWFKRTNNKTATAPGSLSFLAGTSVAQFCLAEERTKHHMHARDMLPPL